MWIEPGGSYANRSQFTKTDDAGRFTVRDLPTGMVPLSFHYGKLMAQGKYLALRDADPLTIKLRPVPDAAQFQARSDAAKAARTAPSPSHSGPPRRNGSREPGPTAGPARSRITAARSSSSTSGASGVALALSELPSLEKLRAKYEPLGVVFLTLHTPGENGEDRPQGPGDEKGIAHLRLRPRPEADDEFDLNGMTAERYGVSGYPTLVMIDRQGNVAFHSGIGTKEGVAAMKALGKEMGLDESTMTEADFYRLWEAFFGREIEKVLNRP